MTMSRPGDSGAAQFQIGGYYPTERADGLRIATINIPNPDGGGQDVAEVLAPYAERFVQAVNSFDSFITSFKQIRLLLEAIPADADAKRFAETCLLILTTTDAALALADPQP